MNDLDEIYPEINQDKMVYVSADEAVTPLDVTADEEICHKEDNEPLDEDDLIFGKYKTMEEASVGFHEAQKSLERLEALEKELEEYKDKTQKYEQDLIARDNGFSDRLQMALNQDVLQKELDNYMLAGSRMLDPRGLLELSQEISNCRGKCRTEDLMKIRRFFSPEIVDLVSKDAAMYKHSRQSEYEKMREDEKSIRFTRKLDEFKKLNEQWASSEFNKTLIEQAMDLSDGHIDLTELKEVIEQIKEEAIKNYQNKLSIEEANATLQDQLTVSESSKSAQKGKKWLTREEFYKLTPEQEAAKYDSIVEQIRLENRGMLPRMLTK